MFLKTLVELVENIVGFTAGLPMDQVLFWYLLFFFCFLQQNHSHKMKNYCSLFIFHEVIENVPSFKENLKCYFYFDISLTRREARLPFMFNKLKESNNSVYSSCKPTFRWKLQQANNSPASWKGQLSLSQKLSWWLPADHATTH